MKNSAHYIETACNRLLERAKARTTADSSGQSAENRRQVSRFLVIGALSVATDAACYALLAGPLGIFTHPAKGVGYLAGTVVGFFGNKFWTFGSARRSLFEPIAYGVLYTITLGVNIAVNGATIALFGPTFKPLAFLLATGTTTVLNFLGMRLVAFRAGIRQRRDAESGSPATLPRRGSQHPAVHEFTNG